MLAKSLKIFTTDDQGNITQFPSQDKPAILLQWEYTAERMAGAPTITATLMHGTCLDDLWTKKEFVVLDGQLFYVDQTPTSSKSTDDLRYKHEITFVSERIILENVYLFDVVTPHTPNQYKDRYRSNNTNIQFYGTLHEFVSRLNDSLIYSKLYDPQTAQGFQIIIDSGVDNTTTAQISLENVYFVTALQEIYTQYKLPYYWIGKTCHIGYAENAITTPFEYGHDKQLLSIIKTNENHRIINRITGTGSSDNIPHYYPNKAEDRNDPANNGVWITPTGTLMPPIYRETNGAERFYNALNDTYDHPDGGKYSFPNPYTTKNPMEGTQAFQDIKPTINGIKNQSGQLLGEIADIAFDSDDSDQLDDNNDYIHSYFYVKLHIFNGTYGFNLFKQSTASGGMTFNMTSGNCASCAFEVGVLEPKLVDGHYEFENPVQVDSNGNILSGSYKDKVNPQNIQPQQQDTTTNEVWVALKKDNTTFRVVMPNAANNYKPSVGDTFVITNILLPQAYITHAENELKNAIIKYMSENNEEKFSFSINFSKIFIHNNPDIAQLINENARLIVEYNHHQYTQYVSAYTCKISENALAEISVTLTQEFSVGQSNLRNKITEIATQVIGNSNDFIAQGTQYFLSKRQKDRARGKITFEQGIEIGQNANGIIDAQANAQLLSLIVNTLLQSPKFIHGFTGEGWQLAIQDGLAKLELDELTVRKTMHVFQLVIERIRAVGGQIIVSAANGKIQNVTDTGDNYTITFEGDNYFQPHDLMRCQVFTGDELRGYWVEILAVSGDSVIVSKSEFGEWDTVPKEGDECVLMGNTQNQQRQNLISISATEDGQPRIDVLDGVNSKNLKDALRARLGNLDGISDPWFPLDNQPHGNGLYADNAYLRGTFLLTTGEDIKTKFEIVEGNLTSQIESLRTDLTTNSGFLANPAFIQGMQHWTPDTQTSFLQINSNWIQANDSILAIGNGQATLKQDNQRTVAFIKNSSLIQKQSQYTHTPQININDNGLKEPVAVQLTMLYRVQKNGTLKITFNNTDNTGFTDYTPFFYQQQLQASQQYKQLDITGLWNATGDFTIHFSGEIYIYMLNLDTDGAQNLAYTYRTLFQQTDNLVKITAAIYQHDETALQETGLVIKPQGAGIYTQTPDGKLALIGLTVEKTDADGNTKTVIKLTADNIKLEGLVTANQYFKILQDGSIEATNGKFSGNITADSGSIGNFNISDGNIITNTNGALEIGSNNFKAKYGTVSQTKTVKVQDGITASIALEKDFQYKENTRFTLLNDTGHSYDWLNIGVANVMNIQYFSSTSNNEPAKNSYGYQFAMLGSGHICQDAIVEGMCLDILSFTANKQVELIQPPLWGNRLCVKTDFTECTVVLPDIYSMFSCIGCGIVRQQTQMKFSFLFHVINTGTETIQIAGRCNATIGSQNQRPLDKSDFPDFYVNGTKTTTLVGALVDPFCLAEIILLYDNSQYIAILKNTTNTKPVTYPGTNTP